jgi:PAS domain S-box-containing protein
MVDVTDARRAERNRRDAEEAYRRLVEQIPAITYIEMPTTNPRESHLTYVSPQVEQIIGRSVDDLVGDPTHLSALLHPDDLERVVAENEHAEATGEPFDSVYRILRDDGRVVWLHSRALLVRDERGDPMFWHGVALDVTAEREARQTLRELEVRYDRLAAALDGEPD